MENEGLEGCSLTWLQLEFKASVNASEAIIRYVMSSLDYHKCFICQHDWQSPSNEKNKIEYTKYMFE